VQLLLRQPLLSALKTLVVTTVPYSADAASEKIIRGSLKDGVDHALNERTVVVVDSMNYIKGFRYELYCSARAESTQYCVVGRWMIGPVMGHMDFYLLSKEQSVFK